MMSQTMYGIGSKNKSFEAGANQQYEDLGHIRVM